MKLSTIQLEAHVASNRSATCWLYSLKFSSTQCLKSNMNFREAIFGRFLTLIDSGVLLFFLILCQILLITYLFWKNFFKNLTKFEDMHNTKRETKVGKSYSSINGIRLIVACEKACLRVTRARDEEENFAPRFRARGYAAPAASNVSLPAGWRLCLVHISCHLQHYTPFIHGRNNKTTPVNISNRVTA